MNDLRGKTAFVTGGASGIGKALALQFAAEGMAIVIADRDSEALSKVAARLTSQGADVLALNFDVADQTAWKAAVSETRERFGGIEILCNNAGVTSAGRPLEDIPPDDWDWLFSINVAGVRNGLQAWLPSMKAGGMPGHIVNTASILGHFAMANVSDYVASKYAVVGLSESLRIELSNSPLNISVLCPGLVETAISNNRLIARPTAVVADTDKKQVSSKGKPRGAEADAIAAKVLTAIKANTFWIVTPSDYKSLLQNRNKQIISSMRSNPIGEDIGFLAEGAMNILSTPE